VTSERLLKFTVLSKFRPLETMKIAYDIPKLFHVRTRLEYLQTSNSAFNKSQPLLNMGLQLLSYNHTAYNCPKNCDYCDGADYPNGICQMCASNYALRNQDECHCNSNSSKIESFNMIRLNPDDSNYDLSLPSNAPIVKDWAISLMTFNTNSFFKYSCNLLSAFSNSTTCFTDTINFFNPYNIQTRVNPSTNILNFDMTITNVIGNNMSFTCSQYIKTSTYLLYESMGNDKTPLKQVYLLSNRSSYGTNTNNLLVMMDLSSVRNTNRNLCTFEGYENYTVQNCHSLVLIYNEVPTISGGTSSLVDLHLFKREFFAYIYYDRVSNLTIKTTFIEKYENVCGDCQISIHPALMMRLCTNDSCAPLLSNATLRIKTPVYVGLALQDPVYLFDRYITDVQLFANGAQITTNMKVNDTMAGTTPAKILNFNISTTGVYNFEVRAFISSATYPTSTDQLPYITANFTLTYVVLFVDSDTSILYLFGFILLGIAGFGCCFGIIMFILCKYVIKRKDLEDNNSEEEDEEPYERQLIDYTLSEINREGKEMRELPKKSSKSSVPNSKKSKSTISKKSKTMSSKSRFDRVAEDEMAQQDDEEEPDIDDFMRPGGAGRITKSVKLRDTNVITGSLDQRISTQGKEVNYYCNDRMEKCLRELMRTERGYLLEGLSERKHQRVACKRKAFLQIDSQDRWIRDRSQ
jgi:hypothetical protein